MIVSPVQQCVDEVILARRSLRAFLPTPVANEDIRRLLEVAARAPSGSNTQPWKVYVLQGERLSSLSAAILAAHQQAEVAASHTEQYHYYPQSWKTPYLERRRKVGWDLYALLGLGRENKQGMHAQHGRNYAFFDAPVGLIFTIDRVMEQGSWLDYGMFLQNIMLAAKARGLDTCPQAAFTQYHRIIAEQLVLPEHEMLVCGMSLGYADVTKIENSLQTERASVDDFVRFIE
ncbi:MULTISPECIES: nitroreductase [unclassified Undibacterium]|uniref:nitroreductase n=1 Tax=unclassified Undibacterium TaxID=2630295 RepID=UPI002AC9C75B|nr:MULTISPECIES: nitroreductase [unclassified Undibacterium]MEB0137547.1 nitroreductase [Undibacterium sp. CCC2.1]MEB0170548.1 nitroreductase [Undibacterium sp. CCC1.1]MEB0174489.1 nitroreductase [Undibacterium sp. CCC3.4]MEB0213714.1 nitroreductase [Undibacterium sp. 5I2]WPX43879.1 nitroreductase [Undibacterium sp. CCC3.4]